VPSGFEYRDSYGYGVAVVLVLVSVAVDMIAIRCMLVIVAATLLFWPLLHRRYAMSLPTTLMLVSIFGLMIGAILYAIPSIRMLGMSKPEAETIETKNQDLQILFESRLPYQTSEIINGRVLNTIKIGLKAFGKSVSNCKVYIEKIAPEPPLVGGLPILLDGGGFVLRPDDPEKLVEIAAHWEHVNQFRFSAPIHGVFAETLNYMDDNVSRAIEIKVTATELQKIALFKI
jgi:hypothetical protein